MTRRRDIVRAFGSLAASPLGAAPRATLGDDASHNTTPLPLGTVSVVGTRYHAAARLAPLLRPDRALRLRRDPANPRDAYAIAVDTPEGDQLGWLPRGEAVRLAPLMDAGGQVQATLDGAACEVTPGTWRLAARLNLLAQASPPILEAAVSEQVAHLLRGSPLLAERFDGPDFGARAVMLAGPCAGWQRTKAVEWVPPGALPLPAWEVVARHYRLVGGESARIQTARALAEAKRLGIAVPGAAQPDRSAPPPVLARPPERPRLLLRGRLLLPGPSHAAGNSALHHLSLRQERDHPLGPYRVTVLDRNEQPVTLLPIQAGEMVWRLLEEGYQLSIVRREPGPRSAPDSTISLPYEICLRGDDPPDIAQSRAEHLVLLGEILPESWDTERRFGALPPGVLRRFVQRASPLAHRQGGRLTAAQAAEILAWATDDPTADHDPDRVTDPSAVPRTQEGIGDALAPKRRGRGMPLPQRLRLVALRLEAGLRETPERFFPVAGYCARLGKHAQRHLMLYLVDATLAEAVNDPSCSDQVRDLLERARAILARHGSDLSARRKTLIAEIERAAPCKRRRRSVHCHGVIASDRRLLLLRAIMTEAEGKDPEPGTLRWAFAYAMADYDRDHFVMQGSHIAQRVRALADWIEAEMASAGGVVVRHR